MGTPLVRALASAVGVAETSAQLNAAVAVSSGVTKETRVFISLRRCFVGFNYDRFRGAVMRLNALDAMRCID